MDDLCDLYYMTVYIGMFHFVRVWRRVDENSLVIVIIEIVVENNWQMKGICLCLFLLVSPAIACLISFANQRGCDFVNEEPLFC